MMFYMNSSVFEKYFLANEKDEDILKTQYVLISTRIRIADRDKCENAFSLKQDLFPDIDVCSAMDDEIFQKRYNEQLDKVKHTIAILVRGAIEDDSHIVLLCSDKEYKIKYLKYLAEYIYYEFGYMIYDYKKYADFKVSEMKFDKKKVLKICDKVISEKKSEETISDKEIRKGLKNFSKKELKSLLKKKGLYKKGMDKFTMREILEFELSE